MPLHKRTNGGIPLPLPAWAPVVSELEAEILRRGVTYKSVFETAGLQSDFFRHAERRGYTPSLRSLKKVANVLGFELTLRPLTVEERKGTMPPPGTVKFHAQYSLWLMTQHSNAIRMDNNSLDEINRMAKQCWVEFADCAGVFIYNNETGDLIDVWRPGDGKH